MAGAGGRRQEAGGRKLEAGSWRMEAGVSSVCCQLLAVRCLAVRCWLLRFEVVGDSSEDVAGAGKFLAREGCFPSSLNSCRTELRIATRGTP